jgi:hypothetical protein
MADAYEARLMVVWQMHILVSLWVDRKGSAWPALLAAALQSAGHGPWRNLFG